MATAKAQNRADFLRRLFAVVVSVGFANQLIQMDWVENGKWPDSSEGPHIIFLLLGLFLILQSWEGYFTALENRPLEKIGRFYVDVTIVFVYLLLLTISKSIAAFLLVVCAIFMLYMIWDFLTFKEYYQQYGTTDKSFCAYQTGIHAAVRNQASPLRHKLSTAIALVWFLELYCIYLQAKNISPYVYAVLIFVGLLGYRYDQSQPQHWSLIYAPILIALVALIYLII
jgi:hypothetical protein